MEVQTTVQSIEQTNSTRERPKNQKGTDLLTDPLETLGLKDPLNKAGAVGGDDTSGVVDQVSKQKRKPRRRNTGVFKERRKPHRFSPRLAAVLQERVKQSEDETQADSDEGLGSGDLQGSDDIETVVEPLTLNEAKTRLDKGVNAADFLKKRIDEAGTAFKMDKKNKLKTYKEKASVFNRLLGKGKPNFQQFNHKKSAQSLKSLGKYLSKKSKYLTAQAKKGKQVQDDVIADAGARAGKVASSMEGKVEGKFSTQAHDLQVGLLEGGSAMFAKAIERGDLEGDDFESHRELGRGAFGKVVKSSYLGMGPEVAQKIPMRPSKRDAETGLTDEEQEFKVAQDIGDHKNIGKTLGLVKGGHVKHIIAELAKHGDLKSVFKKMKEVRGKLWREQKRYPEDTKKAEDYRRFAADMQIAQKYLVRGGLQGLAHMNTKGLMHSDIKPANFLLGEDLETKVTDLGLVHNPDETPTTDIQGSPLYWSPETQIGRQLTQKSDVWSMSEILLQKLIGKTSLGLDAGKKQKGATSWRLAVDELNRKQTLKGDKWIHKLDTDGVFKKMKDSAVFKDYIKKTMAFEPGERVTAKQALEHKFMKMTKKDISTARGFLKKLLDK